MLDPEQLLERTEPAYSEFRDRHRDELVLLHFFEGFVDAGQVGHTLSKQLLAHCEHEVIATLDVDQLHDYRSRRPVMTFDTDHWDALRPPELLLHRVVDGAGTEFVVITGPEPDMQWERASAAVKILAGELGVSTAATAYGIPIGVPHTRPTTITGHSSEGDLSQDNALWLGRIEVPGSIGSMLEMRLGEVGVRSLGLATHVPHYLSAAPFGQAVLAATRRLSEVTGLELPLDGLAEAAQKNLVEINTEMESSAEVRQVVAGLEEQYDSGLGTQQVPSAQEIGAEFERFLAERDKGEDR
ncbi:PAC2 family protein [Naumannella halotolerans]|uniref:PAC2 family protein n=1 Tax=Naumannella halotolerans TaxID=993414 RepID=UPI00370D2CAD